MKVQKAFFLPHVWSFQVPWVNLPQDNTIALLRRDQELILTNCEKRGAFSRSKEKMVVINFLNLLFLSFDPTYLKVQNYKSKIIISIGL